MTARMTTPAEGAGEHGLTGWLNEARAGDRNAFDHLCPAEVLQRVQLAIACWLPGYLRSRVDPEDVLQEVREEAWKHIRDLEDVSTRGFHRWLAGIARKRIASLKRHHRRSKRNVIRDEPFRSSLHRWAGPADSHTPSRSAAGQEQLAMIRELLDMLKPSYRDVLVHLFLEGCSRRETAELMDISEPNVSTIRFRALKKLRQLLEEQGIDTTIFRLPDR